MDDAESLSGHAQAQAGTPRRAETPRTELHVRVTELEGRINQLINLTDDQQTVIGDLNNRVENLAREIGLL